MSGQTNRAARVTIVEGDDDPGIARPANALLFLTRSQRCKKGALSLQDSGRVRRFSGLDAMISAVRMNLAYEF
jgi:hypothetical protein